MLQCLKLSCVKGCKQTFTINDLNNKNAHEGTCNGPPVDKKMKVNDIFKLDYQSTIPRVVEDATLHISKQKMVQTETRVAEFKSGGPWVIIKLICMP